MSGNGGTPSGYSLTAMAREGALSPRASPSKRQRTLGPPPAIEGEPSRKAVGRSSCSFSSSSSLCCGICLTSVSEKTIRGKIDGCEHYFCFICIREWARVESKCPMCKRRFSSIRRPVVEGVFDTERVVNVPLRDQVYDPLGTRTVDPYAESKCSMCNGSKDEWLLLLCDLCNIASHTYCVGLGFTVPTGDWFCPDCVTLRESQANEEASDEAHSSLLLSIVREGSSEIYCPVTRASTPSNPSSSVSNRGEGPFHAHESKVPLFGARTRHQCRDVHNRIQALRENWDALRHGSMNFLLGPNESIGKKNSKEQQHERFPEECDGLGKASSSGFQQITDQGGENPASFPHDKVTDSVNKAWRMMDLAKSRQQGHNPVTNVQHAGTSLIMKGKASEGGGSIYQNLSYLSSNIPADKHRQDRRTFKSTNRSAKVGAANSSTACLNFPYSRKKSDQIGNMAGALQDIGLGTTLHVACTQEKSTRLMSLGSSGEGSCHAVGVKSEIQSLVKRSLKMFIGGKLLGVDAFKEIARASTHSILAAYGLEHSKAIRCSSFTRPVCCHLEQDKQQHKASPMPNSCRDCFGVFVRNVVGSIVREKVGHVQ